MAASLTPEASTVGASPVPGTGDGPAVLSGRRVRVGSLDGRSALRRASAGRDRRLARGTILSLPQEVKELDALAQTTPHHRGALEHLPGDFGDLARAEEELAIELLLHLEDV